MKKFALAFLFIPLFLEAITIYIKNDSPYPLIATIYDKQDNVMQVSAIHQGNTYTWYDSYHAATDFEKGPFRVVFTCRNGDEYGTVRNVRDNSHVNARRSIGRKHCGS